MNNQDSNNKNGGFFYWIKNLFILFLFIQFVPVIFMNLRRYAKKAMIPKTQVGRLNINGMIGQNTDFYIKHIGRFLKDPDIKALFLKIDSPGGLPGASQAIFDEVKRFKKEKPVVVFTENVCASGGYYVAAASDYIISTPSALVGSIGVLMQLPNFKKLLNNWDIRFNYVQSGEFKTAGSPLKDSTPEEMAYLQKLSDENYQQFLKDMSESRKLDKKNYKAWADGKAFTGTQALNLKLVDKIGGYQDAIDKIKELADIKTEIKFVKPKKLSGLAKLVYGEEEGDNGGGGFSSKVATFLNEVYINFVEKQKNQNYIS